METTRVLVHSDVHCTQSDSIIDFFRSRDDVYEFPLDRLMDGISLSQNCGDLLEYPRPYDDDLKKDLSPALLDTSLHEFADMSLDDYALQLDCILEDDDSNAWHSTSSSAKYTQLGAGLDCNVQQRSHDHTMRDSALKLERTQLIGEEPRVQAASLHAFSPMNVVAEDEHLRTRGAASDHEVVVGARSKSIGVTEHKRNKQWEAHLWVKERQLHTRKKKGVQIYLGTFRTKEEAMVAHDLAALKLQVSDQSKGGKPFPLNFPESTHAAFLAEHRDWSARDLVWKLRRTSNKFSKGRCSMKGVTARTRARAKVPLLYEAKISQTLHGGQKWTFHLGNFEREEDAGRAYDLALLFFKGDHSDCVTNFRPSSYTAEEIEEAGKKLRREIMDSREDSRNAPAH